MKTLAEEYKKLPNNFKKGRKNLLKKAFLQLLKIFPKNIFLQFDSQTIFDNSYINHRGSIVMLNFKTSLASKTFGGLVINGESKNESKKL